MNIMPDQFNFQGNNQNTFQEVLSQINKKTNYHTKQMINFFKNKINENGKEWCLKCVEQLAHYSLHGKSRFQQKIEYLTNFLKVSNSLHLKAQINFNLGLVSKQMQDYEESHLYFTQSKQIIQQILGQKNPDYAQCIQNIGIIYNQLGYFQDSSALLFESLKIKQECLGRNHPCYATALHNIGLNYYFQDFYDKALEYFQNSLNINRQKYGQASIRYAVSLCCKGNALRGKQMYDQAQKLQLKALEIAYSVKGSNNRNYAFCIKCIAQTYEKKQEYQKALHYFLQLYEIIKDNSHFFKFEIAYALNRIAFLFVYKKDFSNAQIYAFRQAEIAKELYGQNTPAYKECLKILGDIYKELQKYNLAMKCYLKLEKIKKFLGEIDQILADLLEVIGIIFCNHAILEQALRYFLQSLEIRKNHKDGEINSDYASSLNNVGVVYAMKNDYKNGLWFLSWALDIYRFFVQQTHPIYIKIIDNIQITNLKGSELRN